MSNATDNKDSLIKAITKMLLRLFSKSERNSPNGNSSNLDLSDVSDNSLANELLERVNEKLEIIKSFAENNKDDLESAIKEKRLGLVSKMIKDILIPDLEMTSETRDPIDSALSDPLRRNERYQNEILDKSAHALQANNPEMKELIEHVSQDLKHEMSKPSESHLDKQGLGYTNPEPEPERAIENNYENSKNTPSPT